MFLVCPGKISDKIYMQFRCPGGKLGGISKAIRTVAKLSEKERVFQQFAFILLEVSV